MESNSHAVPVAYAAVAAAAAVVRHSAAHHELQRYVAKLPVQRPAELVPIDFASRNGIIKRFHVAHLQFYPKPLSRQGESYRRV